VFRNVGIYKSDAGELPKRKHTRTKILSDSHNCVLQFEKNARIIIFAT